MNSLEHRALLHRELARLLGAGFPIGKAAETLLSRDPSGWRKRVLHALASGLKAGGTIAGSMRPELMELEHSLLDALERGGRIADGFAYLSDYFELRAKTRSRLMQQMIYPLLILHLCVLPGTLPLIFTKGVGAFFIAAAIPLALLWGGIALAFWGFRVLSRRAQTNVGLDRALNAVPVFGKWRRHEALSRFCKVLEISLLAGQVPSQAVLLAGEASDSAHIMQSSRRLSEETAAGNPLAPGMAGDAAFPIEMADGLASAEIAGSLEKEAGRWSGYLQAEANQAAELVAVWLPRVVYGVAVIVAATIIIRFFLGYFSMLNGLMQ